MQLVARLQVAAIERHSCTTDEDGRGGISDIDTLAFRPCECVVLGGRACAFTPELQCDVADAMIVAGLHDDWHHTCCTDCRVRHRRANRHIGRAITDDGKRKRIGQLSRQRGLTITRRRLRTPPPLAIVIE